MTLKNIVFFLIITFGLACSIVIGPFWDIFWHLEVGERNFKYLLSFGKYNNFDNLDKWVKYYPGIYDTFAFFFLSLFPKKLIPELFNILSFLLGMISIIGLNKFCKIHFGQKISRVVILLTLLTPVYFGQMLINPKDIGVSAAFFWCLYYISKYFLNSKNNNYTPLKIGLLIATGTGFKIVFVGLLIPVVLIFFFEILLSLKKNTNPCTLILSKDILLVFLYAYLTLVFLWPSVHNNIFLDPFKILIEASLKNDLFGVPYNLYMNKIILSNESQLHYILINFFFKTPTYILILMVLNIFFLRKISFFFYKEIKYFYKKIFYICIIILIPILITTLLKLKVYDGLRNFLFLLPFINILIAPIIIFLFANLNKIYIKIILLSVFPFFLYFLVIFFKLTPYQYTFTNIINKYLYGSYSFENDYFATSLKNLIKKFSKKNLKSEFKIAGCVNHQVLKYFLKKNNIKNFKIVSINSEFDYAVLLNRPINIHYTCMDYFEKKKDFNELVGVERNGVKLIKIIYK